MPSVKQAYQIMKNMGWRYVSFRIRYELERKTGFFRRKFPVLPKTKNFINLEEWRKTTRFFGISQHDRIRFTPSEVPDFAAYKEGKFPFFSAAILNLGPGYDWLTNPDTGFRYDIRQHWSVVRDYDSTSGDIKYVWEKSRFSFLYDVLRHDHYTGEDHAEWVFNEIDSWIQANPINCGPNYKCSQEISLRVLNWTYALHYYKNSPYLTDTLFQRIIHVIYWQLKHVYANINFSRIAVRNNHAITETLTLFLGGLFYPFFPEATVWKQKGKKWFEQEIDYQIYEDGTFLQFSMNYHRVVIQLFTWAFKTADFFNERFSVRVYEKAYLSLEFLFSCQDTHTGWLPNYGSNDGALFFKLNSCNFRDYRPQLNTLHLLLTGKPLYPTDDWHEDSYWFLADQLNACQFPPLKRRDGWKEFKDGGYYVLRDTDTLTFIRCGKHHDRPAQADNLHLDIWYQGENILFDGGSYKYNTDRATLKYFMGTESHNTVMLGENDQMLKGPRFIWYNWSQALYSNVCEDEDNYVFNGTVAAFSYIDKSITHRRIITKIKGKAEWLVEDEIQNKPESLPMHQLWHPLPSLKLRPLVERQNIRIIKKNSWKSDYYGIKIATEQIVVVATSNKIKTKVSI